MRLNEGQPAPAFEVRDMFGKPIALRDFAGQKLMLSFYRYSSCPYCNLRVHKLMQAYAELQQQGLHMLSFWQSSKATLLKYVGQQQPPFPLIPDPDRAVYRLYGVERSWQAIVKAIVGRPLLLTEAMTSGFYGGKVDGKVDLVPADFLIGPDLMIQRAYYGAHIGDHLPFAEIERFLRRDAYPSGSSATMVGGRS